MAGVLTLARRGMMRLAALGVVAALVAPRGATAQEDECVVLCMPELKIEPTITFENLGRRARVDVGGTVERTPRETIFELIFALDVPTEIRRVGLTLEAIFAPFKRDGDIRDNPAEIESELKLQLFDEEHTGGWVSSHFDIVDKFSPGERPGDMSVYTHKLDFEWDTALHAFNWLPEGRWLRNLEAELSIDYLATGRPLAGDDIGGEVFLDDSSPWSVSLVLVMPLAPLDP